jgi:Ribbon-helix-helix protein, copG family.
MMRKQLYIDEDLDHALKVLARETGQSEAAHVRAALRKYVAERLPSAKADPLDALVGLVSTETGPRDVAADHDRYLHGAT